MITAPNPIDVHHIQQISRSVASSAHWAANIIQIPRSIMAEPLRAFEVKAPPFTVTRRI